MTDMRVRGGCRFRSVEHTGTDGEDEDAEDGEGTAASNTVLQKWSQEYVMRFRCRKDLLDMLLEVEASGLWWHKQAAVRAVDVSISQPGGGSSTLSPTVLIQLFVLLVLVLIYELTELCFPESPDMKELKKLRKKVKKLEGKSEKKKDGDKTPSRNPSGEASDSGVKSSQD